MVLLVTTETAATPAVPQKKITVALPADLLDEALRAYWVDIRTHPAWGEWVAAAITEKVSRTKDEHGLDELPPRPTTGKLPTGPRPR